MTDSGDQLLNTATLETSWRRISLKSIGDVDHLFNGCDLALSKAPLEGPGTLYLCQPVARSASSVVHWGRIG
jgi:hypothetical protein